MQDGVLHAVQSRPHFLYRPDGALLRGLLGAVRRNRAFDKDAPLYGILESCTNAQITAACPDAEVLIAEPNNRLDAQLIASLPKLKLIHGVGVGYNLFDLEAARQAGIPVCNCRGSNARAVAEHAVMLMLCCLRQVKLNDTLVAEGRQDEQQKHCIATGCIRELGDCTVGLVGFGAIARTVAQMLAPFGPKVLYYDPFRADSATEEA